MFETDVTLNAGIVDKDIQCRKTIKNPGEQCSSIALFRYIAFHCLQLEQKDTRPIQMRLAPTAHCHPTPAFKNASARTKPIPLVPPFISASSFATEGANSSMHSICGEPSETLVVHG